jgi:dihydropteroate synthase
MAMAKTYLRPLGLLWGPDALRGLEAGTAGTLAGSAFIAYSLIEVITRSDAGVSRTVVSYAEARAAGLALDPIERMRLPMAGITLERPRIMGIVNVTPDSFSDGGLFAETAAAIQQGKALLQDGAHILDVGGESTRPGSTGVSLQEELQRTIPVIEGLDRAGAIVSIDTRKPQVMEAAALARASIVNDVSALTYSPDSARVAARLGLPVVLMHAQGSPETMQNNPTYADVALDVYDALEALVEDAVSAGINRSLLTIDPGIGFGKTSRHNVELLQQLTLFHGLGLPLLVGLSRKGFTGTLTGEPEPRGRVHGSVSGAVHAALNGAQILRVHDVKPTRQGLSVAMAAVDPASSGF